MPYSEEATPGRRTRSGRLLRGRLNGALRYLLPRLVQLVSYLVFRSSRIAFVDHEYEDRCLAGGRHIIFAGLHEGMMMLPYHFRDRTNGVVMVSSSRDGDIIADTVERFGMRAVRGSSRHGGRRALDAMIDAVRQGDVSAGVIVDGPRGPARVAKAGAVLLARATGLPIVPGTWWARPMVRVGSWDRTIVPLPFSRIVFAFAEPLFVPPDADEAMVEAAAAELTRRLEIARAKAQAALAKDPAVRAAGLLLEGRAMSLVIAVFAVVYAGMVLGGLPGTALDRTGVALIGAIALIAGGALTPTAAWQAIDVATIALLFGLMVVSAQLAQAGFYAALTARITAAALSPPLLLAILVLTAGGLSAVLVNDVVCLAMAPIVVGGCVGRQLDPRPFLLALAAAANVGSAATLIGNPQNILIGQVLHLSFAGYLADAAVPALLGLGVVWWVIVRQTGERWYRPHAAMAIAAPRLDAWQSAKGLGLLAVLMACFLGGISERDTLALAAAALLLVSRRTASRALLAQVDGQLLLLFIALFVVNHAVAASGALATVHDRLAAGVVDIRQPGWLFAVTVVLSNLVSNVPAVMLLLPMAAGPHAGAVLALASTLAGNLLLVGSIANLIVVDQAGRLGVAIGWRDHARAGVPITVLTSALAVAWLWWRAGPG